jgi:hypothetical protein
MTAQLHGQRREIEGDKFAKREQDHVMAPLVHVEPFSISSRMFVVGFSFSGQLFNVFSNGKSA